MIVPFREVLDSLKGGGEASPHGDGRASCQTERRSETFGGNRTPATSRSQSPAGAAGVVTAGLRRAINRATATHHPAFMICGKRRTTLEPCGTKFRRQIATAWDRLREVKNMLAKLDATSAVSRRRAPRG